MEGEVPRPRAGLDRGERGIVGCEGALGGVEPVDHQLVQTRVGDDGEAVVGRDVDGVRVRLALPLRVDARTGVLHKRRGLAEPAVAVNGAHRDAAARVVGDQHVRAGPVHGDEGRARAAR